MSEELILNNAENTAEENAEPVAELSYFQTRMNELGITDEINSINILEFDVIKKENVWKAKKIFRESSLGIQIYCYTIDGLAINYAKDGSRWKTNEFFITRLAKPKIDAKGKSHKYILPTKAGTNPFFGPKLVQKFLNKEKIKTLCFTEGYFKAFKGEMHGLDIVGLSSITHMKNSENGNLYEDVVKLIEVCKVENVIWLQDGDCLDLTSQDIENSDIYKRPFQFFNTANVFRDLFSKWDVKKYFAHVESKSVDGSPKGLDDILVAMGGKEIDVVEDLVNLSVKPRYFYRIDITFSIGALHKYFRLDNIESFFLFHAEKRAELYKKPFTWHGTKYKYNEDESKLEVVVPGEAKNYFRVGDQYYCFVEIPNKYNSLDRQFHRRMKGTITDDHGKRIFSHIPKYQAFCNVPDHVNYQPIINNCFNVYAPFEHDVEAESGEFPYTEMFLKHIFGTGDINWTNPNTGEKMVINEYELGLDYIQILYQYPAQILPILCLVSKENNTGKSDFGKFLKMLFTQNVAIVGNAELSNDFNASWAAKLLIICDEAKIDKQVVVEKIKMLATADKITMNSKGKDHVELDFFGKFLFMSNNEDNFIYASEEDQRYWVRKVPKLEKVDITIKAKIKDEIGSFLHFLSNRKIVTPNTHRGWFHPQLIKTDALKKVIAKSQGTFEKELRAKLRNMFMDFGVDTIYMTQKDMCEEWFKVKYETNYMESVLKEKFKVETYHEFFYEGKKYKSIELLREKVGFDAMDEEAQKALNSSIEKKFCTCRYSYPRWERVMNLAGKQEPQQVWVKNLGRPYRFKKEDFLTPEEIRALDIDPEIKRSNEIMGDQVEMLLPVNKSEEKSDDKEVDDLPF